MRRLLIALGLFLVAAPAGAQVVTGEPDPATVRVRLGPLYMNPMIALTNIGIDTNVFNEANDENPKRDFTLTVEPKIDFWLRMGPTWINSQIGEQVVWYQKYATERSSNTSYRLGWSIPLNRLAFKVNGSYLNTRERPGFEIDTRAHRTAKGLDLAAEFRVLAKTYFGARVSRGTEDFDADEFYEQQNLRTALNRTTTEAALTVRNQLTPLTSLNFDFGRTEDRFEFVPLRDSDSTSITAGFQFDPLALLKGGARVGYRNFQPIVPGVPAYTGTTVGVDLTYVLLGSTRFSIQVDRDVEFSFDVNQPYYVQTALHTSIAQQVFGPLDVVARYGTARLAYRDRAGAIVEAANRTDRTHSYGGGFGYHLGRELRLGFNIDQYKRESPIDNRRYEGLKFGAAVTYGL